MPTAAALVVWAHLETCPHCRDQIDALEQAAGAELEASEPARLSGEVLERVLATLDDPSVSPAETETDLRDLGDVRLPAAVARVGLKDRRFLAPGLWAAPLRVAPHDGWRTFLLRVPAETTVPTHGHRGGELIAVLSGGFQDGEAYSAGDFAENAAGHDHQLSAMPEQACVCLVAIQGRVQWRGWARMIGPILGM